jgi:hypothetical protein
VRRSSPRERERRRVRARPRTYSSWSRACS